MDKKEEILKIIRSILISSTKQGMSLCDLQSEFFEFVGKEIPIFEYRSIEDFLNASGEFLTKENHGQLIISEKPKEESRHISKLIAEQRKPKGLRRFQSSFRGSRFRTLPRNYPRSYPNSNTRSAIKSFVSKVNNNVNNTGGSISTQHWNEVPMLFTRDEQQRENKLTVVFTFDELQETNQRNNEFMEQPISPKSPENFRKETTRRVLASNQSIDSRLPPPNVNSSLDMQMQVCEDIGCSSHKKSFIDRTNENDFNKKVSTFFLRSEANLS